MQSSAHPVPYVPFRTFLTAIETLERGCPHQIDRSVWPSYSGAIQGQLLAAFRFLGLIDENQCPTAELRELLARKENRRALLRRLLEAKYPDLIRLDLANASPRQLDEAMRRYGLNGATHKKAVSFFLQAAQHSGLPLSVLLRSRTRGGRAGQTKRRPAAASDAPAPVISKSIELNSGGVLTLTAAVDFFAISPEDRSFVFELIDRMQQYSAPA